MQWDEHSSAILHSPGFGAVVVGLLGGLVDDRGVGDIGLQPAGRDRD
jgi:hypothetical protein